TGAPLRARLHAARQRGELFRLAAQLRARRPAAVRTSLRGQGRTRTQDVGDPDDECTVRRGHCSRELRVRTIRWIDHAAGRRPLASCIAREAIDGTPARRAGPQLAARYGQRSAEECAVATVERLEPLTLHPAVATRVTPEYERTTAPPVPQRRTQHDRILHEDDAAAERIACLTAARRQMGPLNPRGVLALEHVGAAPTFHASRRTYHHAA